MTLREARLRRMWSMHRLADEATVGVKTISEIEAGQTGRPRLSTMTKLAAALGCSVYDILWPGDPQAADDPVEAFWEAKRREALSFPEPARTALLEGIDRAQYGDVRMARRIHAEHVVDGDAATDAEPAEKSPTHKG